MRLDIRGSQALQDVVLAIQSSDREVRSAIRAQAKANMTTPWLSEINERASTSVERRVLAATAVIAVSDQGVRVQSAGKGRRLSGGLFPKQDFGPVEFGANHNKRSYTRKGHRVTRNTTAQFKPRNRSGYVFYPAAREMIPRLARMWVQTIVKFYADIFEGR